MTHAELVALGVRWLRDRQRCLAVISENVTAWSTGECPDGFGINGRRETVLVECKASRADFLADRRKKFRALPGLGVGVKRYFLAERHVVGDLDLPERWGLLVPVDGRLRCRIKAEAQPANRDAEFELLFNVVRAYQAQGIRYLPCVMDGKVLAAKHAAHQSDIAEAQALMGGLGMR